MEHLKTGLLKIRLRLRKLVMIRIT